MSKIYIVEDDQNIGEMVAYSLKNSGFEASVFESATPFYNALSRELPDLILMDIMLPGEDGIFILKKLKQNNKYSQIPVIMLTAKGSEYDKIKGLDLGADDYITKPFSVLELVSRVKAVLRRVGESKEEQILTVGKIELDILKRKVFADSNAVSLTLREFELLVYLMQNEKIVFSRNKLMEQVWGFDFEGESRTVDMHIKTLRQKLGVAGDQIKTIRGVGYCIGE